VKTGPNPSLSATITNSSLFAPPDYENATAGGQDYAELDYSLDIIGPAVTVPVLINASGGYSASFGPGSYYFDHGAYASFSVDGVVNDHVGFDFDSTGNPAPPYSFFENNTYMMLTNHVYSVSLEVNVLGTITQTFGGGTETISAYVDPTFAIGSGVADPSLYSIEVSPGIGNSAAAATPEPSTWAMMLLGFAGLGWAGYRGRLVAPPMGTPT
jgi:hypothetical protein